MEVYQVGPDDPGVCQDERFSWVVHHYAIGDYDGSGEAVAFCKETGLLHILGLDHCSCYGPLEDGLDGGRTMTVEEFLADQQETIFDYQPSCEVMGMVRSLLLNNKPV